MTLDFYHNKIVADVISEEFEACFMRELVPLLNSKYGQIDVAQMYEDYIADELTAGGYWYYPLTLVIGEEIKTQWIRWEINKTDFEDGLPYAFSGSGNVGFELCDAPRELEAKIAGRSRYYAGGSIGVRIEVVKGESYRLSGRYSQTFIDEMARQLTPAIESATGVTGIADSSVELVMVFASGTYMEHISENVTYRRLMLVDKVSAPRDFWIKWTRLDGAVAHPISAHVSSDNILFELGEDVDQKILQREYRYLLQSGSEKYHNSMSRKKVTEWREVIKRAARRGELTKVESDFELAPETLELEERIADLLGKKIAARSEPAKAEVPYITADQPESAEFTRAMEMARMMVEGSVNDESEEITLSDITSEIPEDEPAEDIVDEPEDEPLTLAEDEPESDEQVVEFEDGENEGEDDPDEFNFDEEIEESEEEAEAEEADLGDDTEDELDIFDDSEPDEIEPDIFAEAEPEIEESAEEFVIEDAPAEELVIEDDTESDEDEEFVIEEEPKEELVMDDEIGPAAEEEEELVEEFVIEDEPIEEVVEKAVEEAVEEESAPDEAVDESSEKSDAEAAHVTVAEPGIAERVADIRAELETKIRLEYEIRAREKAERELVELRHKLQKTQTDSELAIAELKNENERLQQEYDRLIEQIESERFAREAEEARRRLEEKQLREQIEKQLRAEAAERERLAESARMAMEEKHRLEAENARITREREEEERAEAERLRVEEHERELEAIRQAELERIRREQEDAKARAKAAMPEMGDGKYSYTTKTVKLVFRRSVDPNITTRIQQLIKTTVDYYGKDSVYLRIRATVPDTQTVLLDFVDIPLEEMPLLGNIIKVLGNGGLGIAKAIIE